MANSKKSTKKGYTRSLEEVEMILDNIPGLVFYKDDKNNLIRVNKYFADAHKTTKEALAGKNCFDIYPKDVAQKYFDDDLEVIKSKKPKFNFIEPWDVVEGRRWLNSSKIPLFDENNNCIGGADPKGLCAGAIYLITKLKNKKISQKEISSVVGVTEVTLCSRYKEFLTKLSFNFE